MTKCTKCGKTFRLASSLDKYHGWCATSTKSKWTPKAPTSTSWKSLTVKTYPDTHTSTESKWVRVDASVLDGASAKPKPVTVAPKPKASPKPKVTVLAPHLTVRTATGKPKGTPKEYTVLHPDLVVHKRGCGHTKRHDPDKMLDFAANDPRKWVVADLDEAGLDGYTVDDIMLAPCVKG